MTYFGQKNSLTPKKRGQELSQAPPDLKKLTGPIVSAIKNTGNLVTAVFK